MEMSVIVIMVSSCNIIFGLETLGRSEEWEGLS